MKQLDPKAVWLFFLSYVLRWFFITLFLGGWLLISFFGILESSKEGGAVIFIVLLTIAIGLPVFMILCYIVARLTYHYYRYELTENGFRKESGIIYKRYVTIPYDRIQNVDIYRGLLARILGLSDLQIQTAGASAMVTRSRMGGMGAEGRLLAVSHAVAEQLRDELVQRASHSKKQGV